MSLIYNKPIDPLKTYVINTTTMIGIQIKANFQNVYGYIHEDKTCKSEVNLDFEIFYITNIFFN